MGSGSAVIGELGTLIVVALFVLGVLMPFFVWSINSRMARANRLLAQILEAVKARGEAPPTHSLGIAPTLTDTVHRSATAKPVVTSWSIDQEKRRR